MPAWGLSRIVVTHSGGLKAVFSDGVLLVLSEDGQVTTLCQGGSSSQQLTRFLLSKHLPRLTLALEFRNLHLDHPYYHVKACSSQSRTWYAGYLLREVAWPASVQSALAGGLLTELPAGGVQVLAEQSSARLVLHALGHRVAVCYPLLVRTEQQNFEYVWQTSLFSCSELPQRWHPGLLLAVAAQELFCRCGRSLDSRTASVDSSLNDTDNSQPNASELPTALCASSCSGQSFPAGSWWLDQGATLLPPDEVVHFEWTQEATYQYIEGLQEVEVWVHADESCLKTQRQGSFVAHYRVGADRERVYAADGVPSHVWDSDGHMAYALAPIAAHACMLRQVCAAVSHQRAAGRQDEPLQSQQTADETLWQGVYLRRTGAPPSTRQGMVNAELAATARAQMVSAPVIIPEPAVDLAAGESKKHPDAQDAPLQPTVHVAVADAQLDIIDTAEMSLSPMIFMAQHERNSMVEDCLARNAQVLANLS